MGKWTYFILYVIMLQIMSVDANFTFTFSIQNMTCSNNINGMLYIVPTNHSNNYMMIPPKCFRDIEYHQLSQKQNCDCHCPFFHTRCPYTATVNHTGCTIETTKEKEYKALLFVFQEDTRFSKGRPNPLSIYKFGNDSLSSLSITVPSTPIGTLSFTIKVSVGCSPGFCGKNCSEAMNDGCTCQMNRDTICTSSSLRVTTALLTQNTCITSRISTIKSTESSVMESNSTQSNAKPSVLNFKIMSVHANFTFTFLIQNMTCSNNGMLYIVPTNLVNNYVRPPHCFRNIEPQLLPLAQTCDRDCPFFNTRCPYTATVNHTGCTIETTIEKEYKALLFMFQEDTGSALGMLQHLGEYKFGNDSLSSLSITVPSTPIGTPSFTIKVSMGCSPGFCGKNCSETMNNGCTCQTNRDTICTSSSPRVTRALLTQSNSFTSRISTIQSTESNVMDSNSIQSNVKPSVLNSKIISVNASFTFTFSIQNMTCSNNGMLYIVPTKIANNYVRPPHCFRNIKLQLLPLAQNCLRDCPFFNTRCPYTATVNHTGCTIETTIEKEYKALLFMFQEDTGFGMPKTFDEYRFGNGSLSSLSKIVQSTPIGTPSFTIKVSVGCSPGFCGKNCSEAMNNGCTCQTNRDTICTSSSPRVTTALLTQNNSITSRISTIQSTESTVMESNSTQSNVKPSVSNSKIMSVNANFTFTFSIQNMTCSNNGMLYIVPTNHADNHLFRPQCPNEHQLPLAQNCDRDCPFFSTRCPYTATVNHTGCTIETTMEKEYKALLFMFQKDTGFNLGILQPFDIYKFGNGSLSNLSKTVQSTRSGTPSFTIKVSVGCSPGFCGKNCSEAVNDGCTCQTNRDTICTSSSPRVTTALLTQNNSITSKILIIQSTESNVMESNSTQSNVKPSVSNSKIMSVNANFTFTFSIQNMTCSNNGMLYIVPTNLANNYGVFRPQCFRDIEPWLPLAQNCIRDCPFFNTRCPYTATVNHVGCTIETTVEKEYKALLFMFQEDTISGLGMFQPLDIYKFGNGSLSSLSITVQSKPIGTPSFTIKVRVGCSPGFCGKNCSEAMNIGCTCQTNRDTICTSSRPGVTTALSTQNTSITSRISTIQSTESSVMESNSTQSNVKPSVSDSKAHKHHCYFGYFGLMMVLILINMLPDIR